MPIPGNAPRLLELFSEALELTSAEERAAYLDRACGPDPGLRGRVERLVADHFRAGSFLEHPPAAVSPDATAPFAAGGGGAAVGDAIGPYKLRERIGEGGMGPCTWPTRRPRSAGGWP